MNFKFRNKQYELCRDSNCFQLSELKLNKKTKEKCYGDVFYFINLASVINYLFEYHVLDKSESMSLINCITETKRELKEILQGN